MTGVPPDYFAADGQRWNNPHYDWAAMAGDGYAWWRRRIARQRDLFDLVRIDPETLSGGPLRTSLLRLTVETAHTFGWEVVAGGVVGAEQLRALAGVGCAYAQGPIPRRTVAALSSSTRPQVR